MNNGPIRRTLSAIALTNLESAGRASPPIAPRPPHAAEIPDSPDPSLPPGDTLESLMEAGQLRRQVIEQRTTPGAGTPATTPLQRRAPRELTMPPPAFANRPIGRLVGTGLTSLGALSLGSSVSMLIYSASGSLESSIVYLLSPLTLLVGFGCLVAGFFLLPALHGSESSARVRQQLRAWYQALGLPATPQLWHEHSIEQTSTMLHWLEWVRNALTQSDPATRQQVLSRVRYVVAALDEASPLRQGLFEIATSVLQHPAESVSWGLDLMEIMVRNWHATHGGLSSVELFQIARGMYRIDTIRQLAEGFDDGPINLSERLNPDEVASELQYGLRDRLSLPISVSPPQHDLQLLPDQIEMVGDAVMAMEQCISPQNALDLLREQQEKITHRSFTPLSEIDKNSLALFIAKDFEPWRSHINRTAGEEIEALKRQARAYQNRLDDLPEDAALPEQDYLISTNENMFLHNHGVAYKKALIAMLEE